MPLPKVQGWIVDFYTAQAIFESQNNMRISHCIDACKNGIWLACHHEEKLYKNVTPLKECFLDQDCVCYPDPAIMSQCINVARSPLAKKMLPGNQAPIIITAVATCKGLGVISDSRSPIFSTTYDYCMHFGVHVFSADEYFALT